jgi:selenide,water dikinase
MKTTTTPVVKDLVLVGGGHSHVAVLKRFGMKPVPGVRLTLICRDVHTPYSGMLPGLVAGHYEFDDAHIDLGALARFSGARFFQSSVTRLDLERKRVLCDNRPAVPYDLLSINTGSAPRTYDVPGATENAIPVKPINRFLARWEALRERALDQRRPMRIAVVGAGAGGVEILLAIQYRLRRLQDGANRPADRIEYHLFSESRHILPTHSTRVRRTFEKVLRVRGVTVHLASPVVEVASGRLRTGLGEEIEADEVLWVTAAGAPSTRRVSSRSPIRCNPYRTPRCSPPATSLRWSIIRDRSPACSPYVRAVRWPTICGAFCLAGRRGRFGPRPGSLA